MPLEDAGLMFTIAPTIPRVLLGTFATVDIEALTLGGKKEARI